LRQRPFLSDLVFPLRGAVFFSLGNHLPFCYSLYQIPLVIVSISIPPRAATALGPSMQSLLCAPSNPFRMMAAVPSFLSTTINMTEEFFSPLMDLPLSRVVFFYRDQLQEVFFPFSAPQEGRDFFSFFRSPRRSLTVRFYRHSLTNKFFLLSLFTWGMRTVPLFPGFSRDVQELGPLSPFSFFRQSARTGPFSLVD